MIKKVLISFCIVSTLCISHLFCIDNYDLINNFNENAIQLEKKSEFELLDDLIISGSYFYTSQYKARLITEDQNKNWDIFFHEWCVKETRNHINKAKSLVNNNKRNDAINELLHAQYLWNRINSIQDNAEITELLNTLIPNRID